MRIPEPPLDPPASYWGPDPVECSGCGRELDETNAPAEDLEYIPGPKRPRSDEDDILPLPRCYYCRGSERCLACGYWLDPVEVSEDPLGCPNCGAASRHGVEMEAA